MLEKRREVRWQKRFEYYQKALLLFNEAIEQINKLEEQGFGDTPLDDLAHEGLIQRFEYTFELGWNVMRDFHLERGAKEIFGARDAIRAAFASGLLLEGRTWMDMLKSRNLTSHTYNEVVADDVLYRILNKYHQEFNNFKNSMTARL
jgi:nucleotidyltransferase substrate binding protein (TIGR01987 family)